MWFFETIFTVVNIIIKGLFFIACGWVLLLITAEGFLLITTGMTSSEKTEADRVEWNKERDKYYKELKK